MTRLSKKLAAVTIGGLAAAAGVACRAVAAGGDGPAGGPGVAVVELFTSEGCSSCPPADAALSKLVAAARASGRAVYPLAFHVDYWNHGGWADRFSTAAASARQQAYATALHLDGPYTPQAVVNGTTEFVGSDTDRLSAAVAAGLAAKPAATVAVRATVDGHVVHAAVDVAGGAGDVLTVALVERGLSTAVGGGENQGRRLRHDGVVRGFATADVAAGGRQTVDVAIPADVLPAEASVVAYVQAKPMGAVAGAAAVDLPPR